MNIPWQNNTIICVDDEESIRDIYQRVLSPVVDDPLDEIFNLANDLEESGTLAKPDFILLLASSGEEAIQIIQNELKNGRRIGAGFFDMRMPGGMDGYETIKAARLLDSDLICSVVTAYTDREVDEIRSLFTDDHQDELLYIKKPFSVDELNQAAVNMLSSWNRKRKLENYLRSIEKQRDGLRQILHAISMFNKIPPHSLRHLTSGLLFQLLSMVDGEDGFCVLYANNAEVAMNFGIGRYEHDEELPKTLKSFSAFDEAFTGNRVVIEENTCSIPFVSDKNILGAMRIESANPILEYLGAELLEVFRNQVSSMIMSSIYYEKMVAKDHEAITDSLTGLYNRRFYSERLREEIDRSLRKKSPISMMMIDIDNFKKINDAFGNEAGDRILQSIANIMQMTVRKCDIAANLMNKIGEEDQFAIRYGGEEFSLVLLDTGSEGALITAERLRKRVEEHIFRYGEHEIFLTVSIGLYTEEFGNSVKCCDSFLTDLYTKADAALYQAKEMGKNRSVVYVVP